MGWCWEVSGAGVGGLLDSGHDSQIARGNGGNGSPEGLGSTDDRHYGCELEK